MKSILVIAAHPDDETLGCGGTMARLAQEGKAVHLAFAADGVGSRTPSGFRDQRVLAARRLTAANACSLLGVRNPRFGDFPGKRPDTVPLLGGFANYPLNIQLSASSFRPMSQ